MASVAETGRSFHTAIDVTGMMAIAENVVRDERHQFTADYGL